MRTRSGWARRRAFIDWTSNPDAKVGTNNAIRIAAELGSIDGVSVHDNFLIGGSATVFATPAGGGTLSNVSIDNNYIGFGAFGAFYPGNASNVTMSGTQIVDFSNRAYSDHAWQAYLAAGIHTDHLVMGTAAADTLTAATTGSTTLYGGGGSDHLNGGAHDTVFIGGYGAQYLWGGSGKNTFTYLSVADSTPNARDIIGNFHDGQDVIDLRLIDADLTKPGLQAFTFIGSNPFSAAGSELRVVQDVAAN